MITTNHSSDSSTAIIRRGRSSPPPYLGGYARSGYEFILPLILRWGASATNALNPQITALQTQVIALKAQIGLAGGGRIPAGLVQGSSLSADAGLLSLGYTRFDGIQADRFRRANRGVAGGRSPAVRSAACLASVSETLGPQYPLPIHCRPYSFQA